MLFEPQGPRLRRAGYGHSLRWSAHRCRGGRPAGETGAPAPTASRGLRTKRAVVEIAETGWKVQRRVLEHLTNPGIAAKVGRMTTLLSSSRLLPAGLIDAFAIFDGFGPVGLGGDAGGRALAECRLKASRSLKTAQQTRRKWVRRFDQPHLFWRAGLIRYASLRLRRSRVDWLFVLWFLSLDLVFEDSGRRDLPDALARDAAYAFGLIVFFSGPASHKRSLSRRVKLCSEGPVLEMLC